jgi:hypothetical protein
MVVILKQNALAWTVQIVVLATAHRPPKQQSGNRQQK